MDSMTRPSTTVANTGRLDLTANVPVERSFYGVSISATSIQIRSVVCPPGASARSTTIPHTGALSDEIAALLGRWFDEDGVSAQPNRPVVALTGSDSVEVGDVTRVFRNALTRCVTDVDLLAALKGFVHDELGRPADPVLVVDLGKSGTSSYLVDGGASPRVLRADRIAYFSGDVIDEVVRLTVVSTGAISWPPPPDQLPEYRKFFTGVKEQLTGSLAVRLPDGGATLITREQFDRAVEAPLTRLASSLASFVRGSALVPTSVVLIGGGAVIPIVGQVLSEVLKIPVAVADDAIGAVAVGAARVGSRTHPKAGCAACAER